MFRFHTDHHFIIGHGHVSDGKPCQDYVLSGVKGDYAYAVVSDGCSGGGQTDIGSRIITSSTVKAIKGLIDRGEEIESRHIYSISKMYGIGAQEILGLSQLDMMGTQLFATISNTGHASISVYGDGAVVLVTHTGLINAYVYEWARNAPFYPHQNRMKFIDCHGGPNKIALLERYYQIVANDEVAVAVEHPFSVEDGCKGITFSVDVEKTNTALICLITDGINQVDNMSLFEVLKGLIGFKTLSGEFVKRRLIRFVSDSQKLGWGPVDDLGIAVIAIARDE